MKGRRWFAALAVAWCTQLGTSYGFDFDWLDKLSGPGPFGGFYVSSRFLCLTRSSDQGVFPEPAREDTAEFQRQSALLTQALADLRAGGEDRKIVEFLSPLSRSSGFLPVKRLPAQPTIAGALAAQPGLSKDTAVTPANAKAVALTYARRAADLNCARDRHVRNYLSVGFGRFRSKENNLFPHDPEAAAYQVTITQYEVIYGNRLHASVDVTAAAGLARFSGDAFDSFNRFVITPVSVDFAPFALIEDDQRHRGVKLSLGWTMFLGGGGFSADSFCTPDRLRGALDLPANAPNPCTATRTFNSRFESVARLILKLDPAIFYP